MRGLYVLKHTGSDYTTINVLRPYSAFNIPITRRDPGPDGVLSTGDDGGKVTIYDYDPAYRGSNFVGNQEVNRPDGRSDYYNSYEASITRRMTRSWSMLAAYTGTKYHRWIAGIPQSPNDEFFPTRRPVALGLQAEWQLQLPEGIFGRRDRRGPQRRARPAHLRVSRDRCERPAAAAAGVCDHPARAVWVAA